MNHPKGEESTSVGEPSSNCPQQLCSAAEPAPTNAALRPGRTFTERNLCGGFRSLSFWQSEPRLSVFVRWAQCDAPDRSDRDDHLLFVNREGQETEARPARDGPERQAFAARHLHF